MASSRFSEKAKELLQAASSGNLRSLKEVAAELNKGKGIAEAIKEVMDENGYSVFHLAALHGKLEICQYFVEDLGFRVDFLSAKGETPLFHAAMGGRIATARYLISRGANPVASDIEGWTPLHCAAQHGQDELVMFLLSLGVPTDIECNYATGTPLIIAARYGEASTMKILLEHHADVNRAANNDYTPLLLAVHVGSLKCTKLLVEAGADLNLKYPLEMAIHGESTEIIKYLLDAGADPNIRNEYGCLPIEIAAASNKIDIVEMLFPLTFPFPEVHDWSLQGILQYADLKVKGADALKRNEFLAAICFYSKEYEQASQAFMDALHLDPGNEEIRKDFRKALDSMRESHIGGPRE